MKKLTLIIAILSIFSIAQAVNNPNEVEVLRMSLMFEVADSEVKVYIEREKRPKQSDKFRVTIENLDITISDLQRCIESISTGEAAYPTDTGEWDNVKFMCGQYRDYIIMTNTSAGTVSLDESQANEVLVILKRLADQLNK